jgi:hypothetical protein
MVRLGEANWSQLAPSTVQGLLPVRHQPLCYMIVSPCNGPQPTHAARFVEALDRSRVRRPFGGLVQSASARPPELSLWRLVDRT